MPLICLHLLTLSAQKRRFSLRPTVWLFLLTGVATCSVAGLAQDASTVFTSLAGPYRSVTALDVTVSGTVGQGDAKLTVNGHLRATSNENAVLTLTTDKGTITERFSVSDGVADCSVVFLRPSPKNDQAELCGAPVPWFAPFAFLSAVSPRRLSFGSHDGSQVLLYASTNINTSSALKPASAPSGPRFHFDANSHLVELEYSVPSHGRQQYSNHVSVTYSDYVIVSGVPFPSHVQQTFDGTPLFDLAYSYSAGGNQ